MTACLDKLKMEETEMGKKDAAFDELSLQHEVSRH